MVNYGKYIKINRYLQKKSISELCDGICTPSTLSKIENNKSNINPKIINQILESSILSQMQQPLWQKMVLIH